MNEDDTFRKLKKIPYDDMKIIYRNNTIAEDDIGEFLNSYGWTRDEFVEALLDELKSYAEAFK